MAKQRNDEKLLKHVSKYATLEAELQLVFPIRVFEQIELLCRRYLESAKHDHPSRDLVSKLAFALRQETFAKFGHDSLETFILSRLLKDSDRGWRPKPPRLDAISHIKNYPSKAARFDTTQEAAAVQIAAVWEAFGKFRFVGGRGMEGGGGKSQILHPLDVMGDDLWEHYCKMYKPWYEIARYLGVNRRRNTGQLSLAALTFMIVVEDHYPEEIDASHALVQGTALRALKTALSGYWDLEALKAFASTPSSAPETRQGGRLAAGRSSGA